MLWSIFAIARDIFAVIGVIGVALVVLFFVLGSRGHNIAPGW
jgi:hypothetical protein